LLKRRGAVLGHRARFIISVLLLAFCMAVADRFGLVALIANGYRALAYILIAVYVLPVLTIGLWRLTGPPTLKEVVECDARSTSPS
jgi:uncharacterized membrane protein YkvI